MTETQEKVPSGSLIIDELLDGGYEKDVVTTIYGPAGSGKTNLCMIAAIEAVKRGKKVIYIDTEGGFSIARFSQLTSEYKEILEKMIFFTPTTFPEQRRVFEKLKDSVNESIGLIIVDTIAMLYRLQLGQAEEVFEINRELGKQISYLTEITRKRNIPVLLSNQVYANLDENKGINMVGGDILKYGSKCLIELKNMRSSIRIAVLRKHRSLAQEKYAEFKITEKGIEKINNPDPS